MERVTRKRKIIANVSLLLSYLTLSLIILDVVNRSAENKMAFHKEKMDHLHFLESKLRPEMTVKPSALWQKRRVCAEYYLSFLSLI